MSQKVHKFGTSELIKFIEIYRAHECLWNTEDSNYKNRDARSGALEVFAQELGLEGFGPKEVTNKIKNLRTQYHGEKKKIRDSMGTGSGAADVYKPKLPWFEIMDSFLTKTSEPRPTTSNLDENSGDVQNIILDYTNENDEYIISTPLEHNYFSPTNNTKSAKTKKRSSSKGYIDIALNKLDNIEKRARTEDQFDAFGKYVACTLRSFNAKNCIHAQDKIYAILSKYRLNEIQDNSTAMSETQSPYSRQGENEEGWWNQ